MLTVWEFEMKTVLIKVMTMPRQRGIAARYLIGPYSLVEWNRLDDIAE